MGHLAKNISELVLTPVILLVYDVGLGKRRKDGGRGVRAVSPPVRSKQNIRISGGSGAVASRVRDLIFQNENSPPRPGVPG